MQKLVGPYKNEEKCKWHGVEKVAKLGALNLINSRSHKAEISISRRQSSEMLPEHKDKKREKDDSV